VAPDGGSFYLIEALQGSASQIVVITNWWEDIKARLGNIR
jgi:hypothetical protein